MRRRIDELKKIDVATMQVDNDPRIAALQQKIDATLVEVFGPDSIEYLRDGEAASLYQSDMTLSLSQRPNYEIREFYKNGITRSIAILEKNTALFEESLQDSSDPPPRTRAIRAFGDLDLHPEISRATSTLFESPHYANAVEDACKVLDMLVKMRSGRADMRGTELMQTVFSPKAPILRFNDLTSETDRSEQQGMMLLFAGAMLALRNPRAHELIKDNPEQALEYIGFLSILAKSLDRARH